MTDRPLRPATDHCLGEPLPRQQANRPQAPPPTPFRALIPKTEILGMSCGISPAFAGLSPFGGQVTHVLRTRAPCAGFLYCYRKLRTRLACVKHAASVRSEPGSNSRLKLVVLKIRHSGSKPEVSFQNELLCVARFTQITERILACLIQLSKSRPSWSCRQANRYDLEESTSYFPLVKRVRQFEEKRHPKLR